MTIKEFNKTGKEEAEKLLSACCGSLNWVCGVMKQSPFRDEIELLKVAEYCWYNDCKEADWLEAFTHHPKIGDLQSLAEKYAGKEQSGVSAASPDTLEALARANKDYENKFGFIFIVCATGKSADAMLHLLNERMENSREDELYISMGEQHKITITRFRKLFGEADWEKLKVSQLTTHVLDTSLGKPGRDISIRLKQFRNGSWHTIAQGLTNEDGRIGDLLPSNKIVVPGNYKMAFETGQYFHSMNTKGFYPAVEIEFLVFDDQHYHVPLLINPFGYSTYRGS
jgi:5-hydroxyisourate hydrolase/2-oxo-4-hydroxy-4-carboxy-5-ureidoimidazoline decarboxylase